MVIIKKLLTTIMGLMLAAIMSLITPILYAQDQVTVKFSVNMSYQVSLNTFKPGTDQVLIRGSFNN